MQIGQILLIGCLMANLIAVISSNLELGKCSKFLSRWGYLVALSLITIATTLLIYYQIIGNFQYSYVYQHTSLDVKLVYRISALWAGQEGSFLLWSCIALWMNLFVRKDHNENKIYQIICCALVCLACFSQPFATLDQRPLDGQGLSTSLRNPWMVLHPPIVFISYTAMAILFAQSFKRVCKKWIWLSWTLLGIGLLTGSIWAYQSLGWGGFWAWDPIENLALVPWLFLSVLVHEREVTLVKARIPFLLAVLGTFMVRSGILAKLSVHSYGTAKLSIPIFIVFIVLLLITINGFHNKKFQLFNARFHLSSINPKKILMYIFSLIVLTGTFLPIITGKNTPIVFFNIVAMIVAIIHSLLFSLDKAREDQRIFIFGLVVDVGLVMAISRMTQQFEIGELLILYCVCLPFVLQLLWLKKVDKQTVFKEIIQIGMSVLIISIIVSTLFGAEGIWLQSLKAVDGRTNIIHQLMGDIVIRENGFYEFKPMINLVFISAGIMFTGGFLEAFREE